MNILTIALLLALVVAGKAQSVPATYPDHMDAKPMEQISNPMPFTEGTFTTVTMPKYDPLAPDWIAGDSVCINSEGRFRPCRLLRVAKPPAKHHSTAPRAHQSHARRKVKR